MSATIFSCKSESTPGAAVAGRILKGVGCAKRPVSLPPPLLANPPLAWWCRAGLGAERCNRVPLGRTLDAVHASGGARWWRARAVAVGAHAGRALRFPPLDTTRFALTGAYGPDRDAPAMTITQGHA